LVALVSNIDDLTRYQFVVNNLSQTLLSSTLQKRRKYTMGAETRHHLYSRHLASRVSQWNKCRYSGTWAQK